MLILLSAVANFPKPTVGKMDTLRLICHGQNTHTCHFMAVG